MEKFHDARQAAFSAHCILWILIAKGEGEARQGHTLSAPFIKLCRGFVEQGIHSKCQIKFLDIQGFNVGLQC